MASTNFDALSVRLSRMIEDAVAAATTDGDRFTSAYRDLLLNSGSRKLLKRAVDEKNDDLLRAYTNIEAQSLASNVKTLASWTGGVQAILSVYNATDETQVFPADPSMKEAIQNGHNKYLLATATQQRYILEAASFFLIGGTTTSSIRLTYVKAYTDLAANDAGGAGDILIPSQYYEMVLDYALMVFCEENPTNENIVRLQQLKARYG